MDFVTLPLEGNDDPTLTCIFCNTTNCELAVMAKGDGRRTYFGMHERCRDLAPRNAKVDAHEVKVHSSDGTLTIPLRLAGKLRLFTQLRQLGCTFQEPVEPVMTKPIPPPASAVDENARTTLHGADPNDPKHKEIDPVTGMQKDYVVLSDEERAKQFVRPLRQSYRHVGRPAPQNPLRDLTTEEQERYASVGYVKYEEYPKGESRSSVVGRFWTQEDLDKIDKGCGGVTTMNIKFAETYARSPSFYSGTFCASCRAHFPVGEQGEFVWEGTKVRVGT